MAAYSKLVRHNCYELGHTWQSSCIKTTLGLALITYRESFKIYAPLYAIAAILRRKNKDYLLKKLMLEILRSSLFLGTNVVAYLSAFCLCRQLLTCFSFFTIGFVPGMLASFLAIILERKDRRGLLALYVSNVAVEMLYNMSVSRNFIKPIKNGEVLLFSVVIAVYMYLFKSKKGLNPSVRSAIAFIVGSSELPPGESTRTRPHPGSGDCPKGSNSDACLASGGVAAPEGASTYRRLLPSDVWPMFESRHTLCRHKDGCLHTILKSSLRCLWGGFVLQAALKTVTSLSAILRHPRALRNALLHRHNFQLGAFLASFTAVFQGMNCLLRRLRGQDSAIHGLLAGLLAGTSMLFYKSSTVAMYLMSKLAEILYMKGIDAGLLPYIQSADVIMYTIAAGLIVHVALLEPHNLRPAYWKFLLKITHGRLGEINRKLLDVYGTKASTLYPHFYPACTTWKATHTVT